MRELLLNILGAIVHDPSALDVTRVDGESTTFFELRCAPEDVGLIIGKNGKTISAIRSLLNVVANRDERQAVVEVNPTTHKTMHIDVLTLFPDMLEGYMGQSMMRRAQELKACTISFVNPRDFAEPPHRVTDDRPYGGGPGMVMKPEPLAAAIESVRTDNSRVILLSPQGQTFEQKKAEALTQVSHLILVCGHYEGVDERIRDLYIDEEISIGDYVLTNGAIAAGVVIDATIRLLPGVLGGEGAAEADSFSSGLLDHPHYTRPEEFQGRTVPKVLLSGNHAAIDAWRHEKAMEKTQQVRPDLLPPEA